MSRTTRMRPMAPPTIPNIRGLFEGVDWFCLGGGLVVVAAVAVAVVAVAAVGSGVPELGLPPEVEAPPAGAMAPEPLTASKGSKLSFKAVPQFGRCWQPSINACRSIPDADISFACVQHSLEEESHS